MYCLTITKSTSWGCNFHHTKTSTPTSFTPRFVTYYKGITKKLEAHLIHEQKQVSQPYSYQIISQSAGQTTVKLDTFSLDSSWNVTDNISQCFKRHHNEIHSTTKNVPVKFLSLSLTHTQFITTTGVVHTLAHSVQGGTPVSHQNCCMLQGLSQTKVYLNVYWKPLKLQVISFKGWPLGSYTVVPTFFYWSRQYRSHFPFACL